MPCGGVGHGFAAQVLLSVQTLGAAQLGCVVLVHPPSGWQQVPCGGWHGLGGPQPRPPVQVLDALHPVGNVTAHPPAAVQHVPAAGHGNGVHTPSAKNWLGNTHDAAAVSMHVPSVPQHAPVWARPIVAIPRTATSAQARTSKRLGCTCEG